MNSIQQKNLFYKFTFQSLYRLIAASIFVLFGAPVMWILLPLRCLNPFARKLGLPNSKLPSDVFQSYWMKILLTLLGVKVKVEGGDKVKDQAMVLMFSHASFLDPLVIMGYSPISVKFVFKRSLIFQLSYIFALGYLYGHIPIDRTNLDSAIKSLSSAKNKIVKYKRVVAIAPEGKRSNNGKLQPFKKGPFHLAIESNVPILPVVIYNNFALWPPGHIITSTGEVVLKFLPEIIPRDGEDVESLQERVKNVMQKNLENQRNFPPPGENIMPATIFYVMFGTTVFFIYNWLN